MIHPRRAARALGLTAMLAGVSGCGHTEEQWQAQIDKYDRVVTKEHAGEEKLDQQEAALQTMRQKVTDLEGKLRALGVDLDSKDSALADMHATLQDRERALAEYKARAAKLEQIKARLELLHQKLDELTKLGLEIHVRKNRMVISLPGDVLFDSGKDGIKKDGKDILAKVAAAIGSDPVLVARDFQVAGHTDSKALKGGAFQDNWGLSVMRARQVLLFLIDPKQGALPTGHWSAAGYADTDPVAPNDTDAGRAANRRCELVVLPSLEEMLDLRSLATTSDLPPPPNPTKPVAPPSATDPKNPVDGKSATDPKKPVTAAPAKKEPPADPAKKPPPAP